MTQTINTCEIPTTYATLSKYLPSIFDSCCFNDDKLPFAVEVLSTEIGHLFEHVLLEYLCELKLQSGAREAVYQGVTSWNWIRDTRGVFHITVNAGLKDAGIFGKAMDQAIVLVHALLDSIAYDPTRGVPIASQAALFTPPNTQTPSSN